MNFFQVLSFVGVERIHSQMIKWLLENPQIEMQGKRKFLSLLFGVKDIAELRSDSISVDTEVSNVLIDPNNSKVKTRVRFDIVVRCRDYHFVVENKLKTGVHQNLTQYKSAFAQEYGKDSNAQFFLLSLIREESDWKPVTYQNLLTACSELFSNDSFTKLLVDEYIGALSRLVEVFSEFDQNPSAFPNVFTDGNLPYKKKRVNLEKLQSSQRYVSEVGLETILLQYYWRKIAKKLEISIPELKFGFGETRGDAFLNIFLRERILVGKHNFAIGIQLQNKSKKLFLASADIGSSKEWINPLQDVFEEKTVQWGRGKPNKARKLAHISRSQKLMSDFKNIDAVAEEIANSITNQASGIAIELEQALRSDSQPLI